MLKQTCLSVLTKEYAVVGGVPFSNVLFLATMQWIYKVEAKVNAPTLYPVFVVILTYLLGLEDYPRNIGLQIIRNIPSYVSAFYEKYPLTAKSWCFCMEGEQVTEEVLNAVLSSEF